MKKKIPGKAIIIIICLAVLCVAGSIIYNKINNGVYHSQLANGEYIQFDDDKTYTHAYNPENDKISLSGNNSSNIEAYIISKGTWKEGNGKITVTTEDSETPTVYLKKDDYLYIENTVFKGVTSDAKLLKNKYVKQISDDRYTEVWFFDDGTMTYDIHWGKDVTTREGKYTRVDDILIVRYDDMGDVAHRFLVLDNGISEDIFAKKLPQ